MFQSLFTVGHDKSDISQLAKIMKKILIASIISLFFIMGCKDEGPEAPPPVPVVQITNMSGTVNIVDSTYIEIGASDDKGIIRVELYMNNTTDTGRVFYHPPYRWLWNAKNSPDSSLFTFFARAYDADGNVSTSPVVIARVLRLAPNTLQLAFANDTAAVLTWYNPSSIATQFEIEKSSDGVNFYRRMTITSDSALSVMSAVMVDSFYNDSSYYYRVRAIAPNLKSSYTNTVGKKIHFLPPANVRIVSMDEDSAKIAWDDNDHLAQGYDMLTSTDGIHFTRVKVIPGYYRSFKIWNTYQTIKTYYFLMRARSNINISDSSNIAFASLNFPAPDNFEITLVRDNLVRFHWRDNSTFGSFFKIEGKINEGAWGTLTKDVPRESTYASLSGNFQHNKTYTFRLYLTTSLNATVYANLIKIYFKDELYTGGVFNEAGSIPVNNVARWNGDSWSPVGDGINSPVYSLRKFNESIFAGGKQVITSWNGRGTSWTSVGTIIGANDNVYSISDTNGQMVAGGTFAHLGTALNGIGRWLGSDWQSMGPGMDGPVYAVSFLNNLFVAAGNFSIAGNRPVNNIASWNTSSGWHALGSGIVGTIYCLKEFNGDLYAGGSFRDTAINANYIAKWDGTYWTPITGSGLTTLDSTRVFSMAVFNGELYVGGRFTSINGVNANNIAKWNGTSWQSVGTGIAGVVRNLYVYNNQLFAGGRFASAGDISASNIAMWDGLAWNALGTGVTGINSTVYAMGTFGSWYWLVP